MNFALYSQLGKVIGQYGLDGVPAYAEKHGLTTLEPFMNDAFWNDPENVRKFGKTAKKHGLKISCISAAAHVIKSGTTEVNPDEVKKLKRLAEIASEWECPYLHHTVLMGTYCQPEALSLDETLEVAAEAAAGIARYAQKLGVSCLYEDVSYFVNGVENFGKFYRAVKSLCPSVGICGDVGNILFVDESPEDFFRAFAKEMKNVHIKNMVTLPADAPAAPGEYRSASGKRLMETPFGEGEIDIAACLRILAENGYDGALALENCATPFDRYAEDVGVLSAALDSVMKNKR